MPERRKVSTQIIGIQALTLTLFFLPFATRAQKDDSVKVAKESKPDSLIVKPKAKHSPSKAVLYSAILPGLGQAYNHKYWKLPILYAGIGVITYFIIFNQQEYNSSNAALTTISNGGTVTGQYSVYSSSDLVSIVQYYHRDRDLSVICAVGIYLINLVDAEVDAQFFSFNISDDISMRFTPQLNVYPAYGTAIAAPGLCLALKFK